VPKPFVSRYPVWADETTVILSDVHNDIGHTLVHFLYTGTYQTLKPPSVGDDDFSDGLLEYKRSLQVYWAAKRYGLEGLEHYAHENMQKYGTDMCITDVMTIAEDIYAELGDGQEGQTWFREYLQEKLRDGFTKDENVFLSEGFLKGLGNKSAFPRLLVKVMDGIYKEKIVQIKEQVGYVPKALASSKASIQTTSSQENGRNHHLELEVAKDATKIADVDPGAENTSSTMNGAEEDVSLKEKKKKSSKKKNSMREEQSLADPEHLQDNKPEADTDVKKDWSEMRRQFEWT
jgi:hypothetical protein